MKLTAQDLSPQNIERQLHIMRELTAEFPDEDVLWWMIRVLKNRLNRRAR
jgi:hypothetical protein